MTQNEVAKLLDVSQATVSLYVGQKRGFSKKINSLLDIDLMDHYARSFAEEVLNNPSLEMTKYFCELCAELRKRGLLSGLRKK